MSSRSRRACGRPEGSISSRSPAGPKERSGSSPRWRSPCDASLLWSNALACAVELEQAFEGVSRPFFLHFSHAYTSGVGLYSMLYLERESDGAVVDALRAAWELGLGIVASHGGTIGHHHGIGTIRSPRYRTSAEGRLHRRIRSALDERGTLISSLLAEDVDRPAAPAP